MELRAPILVSAIDLSEINPRLPCSLATWPTLSLIILICIGDYFGILMDERVTSFPFNVNDNPMYNGTVMIFLGTALWYVIRDGFDVTRGCK